MMYKLLLIKRSIEDIIIFPFILIGRLIALLSPLKKEYRIVYFFPFYHTGGAEKVHAQIADVTGGSDCIIYFTRRSSDQRFFIDFRNSGCDIRDISKYTDNKWIYFMNLIWRGVISGYINRQASKPIVFNGQSNFGYKISRWINKSVPQTELIHSLNTFSYIRIPFLPFYKKTVMISRKRIEDHIELYRKYSIPDSFTSRLIFIPNAIQVPQNIAPKKSLSTIVFIGRDSPEKRLHLFGEMAERIYYANNSLKFIVVGDVADEIKKRYNSIQFTGNVNTQEEMEKIYQSAEVLVLPSSTEGFPLVIMEAMAYGLAIMATPVGDIPYHVTESKNGWLFTSVSDEKAIVDEAIVNIGLLYREPVLLENISTNNIQHARDVFSMDAFRKNYHQLFNELTPV